LKNERKISKITSSDLPLTVLPPVPTYLVCNLTTRGISQDFTFVPDAILNVVAFARSQLCDGNENTA